MKVEGVNVEVRPETMKWMRRAVVFWAKRGVKPKLSKMQEAIWQAAEKELEL